MHIQKPSILFVAPALRTFIQNDIDILSEYYDIKVNIYPWNKKLRIGWYMFRQFILLLFTFQRFDAIIISFGGYWSLIPSLFGKILNIPTFTIVHGTDCASIPSVNYGMLRKKHLRQICQWTYQSSDMIFPVSDSLIYTENKYYNSPDANEHKQGLKHFFPRLKTPLYTIHNGLDPTFWTESTKRDYSAPLSFIAVISNKTQLFMKGIYDIIEVAKQMPDNPFLIVGSSQPDDIATLPDNIKFQGRVTPQQLRELYHTHHFYLQLSLFEGFGYALAEAMLCGCIPIGSSVNMIPEIIGSSGFIVENQNLSEIISTLKIAIDVENKDHLSIIARNHILKNYSLSKRGHTIYQQVSKFIEKENSPKVHRIRRPRKRAR